MRGKQTDRKIAFYLLSPLVSDSLFWLLVFSQAALTESDWLATPLKGKTKGQCSGQTLTQFLLNKNLLRLFSTKKKLEYIIKRTALGKTISAIPSAQYSQRFIKFIDDAFDDQSKIIALKN